MSKCISLFALLLLTPVFSAPSFARPSSGVVKGDLDAKVLVRKKAPFTIDDKTTGTGIVRVNKDGTLTREGQLGSASLQGHWKVKDGQLNLKWNTGDSSSYKLTFSGKTPLLNGRKPDKTGRYKL